MKPLSLDVKIAKTAAQIEAAITMRMAVFVAEQNVPRELEVDEHDQTATHFIAISDGEVVGASRLRFEGNYGKLERICVAKSLRGTSIGRKIVCAMEAEIKGKQREVARLHSQVAVQHFYEKLGYEVISKPFTDAGILHVKMSKSLTNQ